MSNSVLRLYVLLVLILPIFISAQEWVARYSGPSDSIDYAVALAVDGAGNIYVTGSSYGPGVFPDYDYTTVKYDSAGVEQWVARYNGSGYNDDLATAIVVDSAANVYITGRSWGTGTGYDYTTVKYDSAGMEQWVTRYNGPGNDYDWANAIAVDGAANVYVTGASLGSGTYYDYTTVKYDSAGVEQWVVRYNGQGNFGDFADEIAIDGAANIYVTGNSDGSGTNGDYVTVKYDSAGVEQWVARFCPSPADDWATAIAVDSEGNVYVTGAGYDSSTDYDYTTVKYDTAGVEQWVACYNGPGNDYDWANAIAIDKEGNVYVTGRSWGSGTGFDYATVKYSPTGVEENRLTVKKGNEIITSIFSGSLQLPEGKKCKIYDITGRIVEPSMITRGIYFIEVDDVVIQKVVKIR